MSADNYLYVRPIDGKWTFTMECASDESPGSVRASDPLWDTEAEAVDAAHHYSLDHYVEYGIVMASFPSDFEDLKAMKGADRQAVHEAIQEVLGES